MKKITTKIKPAIFICFVILSFQLHAQQESQLANIAQNPYLINPGAGGLSDVMQIDATSRLQWVGYNEGPRTMVFSAHSQLSLGRFKGNQEFNESDELLFKRPKYSVGKMKQIVGGKASYDGIGVFAKTNVQGSYAIHLPVTENQMIGLGIGLGLSNFRINEDKVVLHDPNDLTYQEFLSNSGQQNIMDMNVGLVYYGEKWLVGISTTQLLNNKVKFGSVLTQSTHDQHFYTMAKYAIFSYGNTSVEPLAILKMTRNTPASLDYGFRAFYKEASWIGLMGRSFNTLIIQVGSNLTKSLYFSYSYEHSVGKIRTANNGTHEIHLGCFLGKNKLHRHQDDE